MKVKEKKNKMKRRGKEIVKVAVTVAVIAAAEVLAASQKNTKR